MHKELIYLVQTDTTVGFSSSDDEKLSLIKQRPTSQKILKTLDSFDTLKEHTRVPNLFKKKVRHAKKTTFIYPNLNSYRVIDRDTKFHGFISKFEDLYSTSANLTKNVFEYDFAYKNSDIVVFTKEGFHEKNSSTIFKLGKKKIVKIR